MTRWSVFLFLDVLRLLLIFWQPTDLKQFSRLPIKQKIKLSSPYTVKYIDAFKLMYQTKNVVILKSYQMRKKKVTKWRKGKKSAHYLFTCETRDYLFLSNPQEWTQIFTLKNTILLSFYINFFFKIYNT